MIYHTGFVIVFVKEGGKLRFYYYLCRNFAENVNIHS